MTTDEKNLHAAIQALYASQDAVTIPDVVDLIERRFGVAPMTTELLSTRESQVMLIEKAREAMTHLRPDTIDWFVQRMEYLFQCAEGRLQPEN